MLVRAAAWARKSGMPFFGICLGLQVAIIEFARNLAGIRGANSAEFDPQRVAPVIDLMEEQRQVDEKGGTMRLGAYPCRLVEGTLAHRTYGETEISERHRHRYEINNDYREELEKNGLVFAGFWVEKNLIEIAEYPDHPWFLGVQFHPEFKSKPLKPHPLFKGFVAAALVHKNNCERARKSSIPRKTP